MFSKFIHAVETHSCSSLQNPRDSGAWWAAVYGVTQSQTQLKWLSSSSSSSMYQYWNFLFSSNSALYRYTTFYLSIFQLMAICTIDFWLLWIILLWLFTHNFLYGHTFSFLLGICLKGEFQGPEVGSSKFTLLQNCQVVFQSAYIIVCSYCEQCREFQPFYLLANNCY